MIRAQRVVVLAVCAALLSLPHPSAAQAGRAGARAPEIDLRTIDGARIRLSDFRGRPVVVTFWASWCPSCREEFPALTSAFVRHQGDGLMVLAVNQRDQELREADVRKFLAEFPAPFPVLLDTRGRSRRDYRLIGLPAMIFVDTGGVIRSVLWGAHPRIEFDRSLARIITDRGGQPE